MLWDVKALYDEQIQCGKPYFSWIRFGWIVRDLHKGIPMEHLIKIIFLILDNIPVHIQSKLYIFYKSRGGRKSHLNCQLACSKIPSYCKCPTSLSIPFPECPHSMHAQLLSHIWLFCNPMDCSPTGSSVHGIFQARILEWLALSYSRGSSQPRDRICISCVSCAGKVGSLPLHHLGILVTR